MRTCDAIDAQLNRVFVGDDGGSGDRNLDVLRCVQGAVPICAVHHVVQYDAK